MPLLRNKFPAVPPTPYAELRPQLRSGDVLLCSGSGIFSTLIQRATRSVWSHVGLIMRLDSIDRVMVLESLEPAGVRTVRLSKYLTNYNNDGRPYPGKLAVIRHQEFPGSEGRGQRSEVRGQVGHSLDTRHSSFVTPLARSAVDRFGYPYDKEQIAIIAARIAAGRLRFSRKDREKLVRPDAYICSEYVALCFEEIGIEIPWDKKGFISPADFACADCFDLVGTFG
ncbi:MAG: hypothetical protein JJU05_08105 [Verrucomicrobia bacterium]|nr:hypothetical protein [Verrucomicrobiota bacterium]